jgi:uncharacterized protein (TIGR03000 family)
MYSMVLMAALSAGGDLPACHRGGCCGCYGGCYGGWGGCHGCWGGCYGCGGCWGGCYGCYGCYGCWGCGGCYGGWGYSTYAAPVAPAQQMAPAQPETIAPPKREGAWRMPSPTSARLIVELPKNAKLFVDDQPMKTTSAKRAFRTPTLEPGQAYYYMLRAEVVRDGKSFQQTKKVVVRAGEEIRATFPNLEQVQTAELAEAKR